MASEDRDDTAERPITAARIRQRAYELWERNHRPEGFEIQFWLLAERELRAEHARRAREDTRETRRTQSDPAAAPDPTPDRSE